MKNKDEWGLFLGVASSERFLGLDPVTTFRLLESSLPEVSDIVRLNDSFDSALLEHVPAVQKTELLLRLIGEAGTAKATKLGNLPKKLVNDFCIHRAKDLAQIQSEEYVPELGALRCLVTDAGWIKKSRGAFSLTKKGAVIVANGLTTENYTTLLRLWLDTLLWAFMDGGPEVPIIQQARLLLLYFLKQKAHEPVAVSELNTFFINAIPFTADELGRSRRKFELIDPAREWLETLIVWRFLERFAKYFGIITMTEDQSLEWYSVEWRMSRKIQTTPLFDATFHWFSPDLKKGY